MAIALVTRAENSPDNTLKTSDSTGSFVATAGNLLAVFLNFQVTEGAAFDSLTDTAGNTFTFINEASNADNRVRLYYAENCLGHATNVLTLTLTTDSRFLAVSVRQFSGVGLSGSLVDHETGTGSGTSISTPGLDIGSIPEGVAFAGMEADATVASGDGGFLLTAFGTYFADEYRIATGGQVPLATGAGSAPWAMVSALFQGVGGGTTWPGYVAPFGWQ